MLFMALMSVSTLFFDIFITWPLLKRVWPKKMMIIGTLLLALFLGVLFLSNIYPQLIFLAPLCAGAYTWCFWLSFHYNTSLIHDKDKHFSATYTNFAIFSNIGIACGPLLWWFLTSQYGIGWSVGIAFVLVFLSVVPLYFYEDIHARPKDATISLWEFLSRFRWVVREEKSKIIYKTFAFVGYNYIIAGVIWPLLIFLFVTDFQKIGIIGSCTTMITILLLYVIWRQRKDTPTIIKTFSTIQWWNWNIWGIVTLLWLLINPLIVVIDIIQKASTGVSDNTVDKYFFDHMSDDKDDKIYALLMREIGIHSMKIIFLVVFSVMYRLFPVSIATLSLPMIISLVLVVLPRSVVK